MVEERLLSVSPTPDMSIEWRNDTSSDESVFSMGGLISGVKESVPIAAGVFTYGIVFGVLARQTQLGFVETLLMSATVFAGSTQFVVLEMWKRPLSAGFIVITTGLINLRYLLMGASLRQWLRRLPRKPSTVCYASSTTNLGG